LTAQQRIETSGNIHCLDSIIGTLDNPPACTQETQKAGDDLSPAPTIFALFCAFFGASNADLMFY
jgi:hypothetical protein